MGNTCGRGRDGLPVNRLPGHFTTRVCLPVLLSLLSAVSVLAVTFDFETVTNGGTSFSSSGRTWTLTGNMGNVVATTFGSPVVGSATPPTNGFMDTGINVARPPGNVGGIKAPAGFVFRASSFDVWPSADLGGSVYGSINGGNDQLGTVGLNYQVIGKLGGVTVITADVTDTARTPAQTGSAVGGYWHHLELGAAFASTDVDTVEFVLVAQAGTAMNYLAVDNFIYSNLATTPTVVTSAQSSVTTTTAILGGIVTADGGAGVTERGIVWATTLNPTTANNKVANGSGNGLFSATVTGLPFGTLVHVRAYAINSAGTSYGNGISFTTPFPPPAVTGSAAALAVTAPAVVIAGSNFDTVPANNTVTFSGAATGAGVVTAATATQLTVNVSGLSTGVLNAVVQAHAQSSGAPVQVATVVEAPAVVSNVASLPINAATITIGGSGFNAASPAGNTVVFNNGAAGTVAAATATSLTVAFTTQPSVVGSLTAVVSCFGGSSGAAVQVATVVPVITGSTANVSVDSNMITIHGFGFSATPGNNIVVFDHGAVGSVTAASSTQLTVTFSTHATVLGPLGASVTSSGVGPVGPVQVASIIAGAATHFTVSAPGAATAGTAFDFTVTALDQFDNIATGYAGTVRFASTDGAATLPSDYAFLAANNGVQVLSAALQTGGTHTISATDTVMAGIVGNSDAIAVGESVSIAATGGTGNFRFTRGGTGGVLVASFQLHAASTAAAADFSLSGGGVTFNPETGAGTVTFPNGSATLDVTLTATPNATGIAKASKTARLDVATGGGYTIGAPPDATVTISQNGFVVFNTSNSGEGSLRQAILNANAIAGDDTITFGGPVFTDATADTITLTSGQLSLAESVTIQGTGARLLTISGNNSQAVFGFDGAAGPGREWTLADLTITGGSALGGYGAAISKTNHGDIHILRCSVSGNSATQAAIALTGTGAANITDSTISNNTSPFGGAAGIIVFGVTLDVTNSTISGNISSGTSLSFGAGMFVATGAVVNFTNCTVAGNSVSGSEQAGGGGIYRGGGAGAVMLRNTVVSGNSAVSAGTLLGSDLGGNPFTSGGSNLIGRIDGASGFSNGVNGDKVGSDAVPLDAVLGPLAYNGGPTQTHALLPGSPAINAGDNASAVALASDQRGAGFPRVAGANVDIGAIEAALFSEITIEQPAGTELTAGAAEIAFGLVNVGSSSAAKTFTIKSSGTVPLGITSVSVAGGEAGDFIVDATGLPGSVPTPAGETTFTVTFSPTAPGARQTTLRVISDDADEGTFDIVLAGAGNALPTLSLPASPVIAEATGAGGATVDFNVTADDSEDGPLTPMVNPASGTVFMIGETAVNVSATDSDGATVNGSFTVRVQDTIAPVIQQHADIVDRSATSLAGVPVTFSAVATDAVGVTSLEYFPPSGSTFPFGRTTVTVTARDAAGHETTSTFDVIVGLAVPVHSSILSQGAAAPGSGTNGLPADALLANFGVPAIDELGEVSFLAKWESATAGRGSGIFHAQTCIAVTGGDAPIGGGATFKTLGDPVASGGRVAFLATFAGVAKAGASGVVSNAAGPLLTVAQSGDEAPQTGGAKWRKFEAVAVEGNCVAFLAQLAPGTGSPKTTAANDRGIWIKVAKNEPVLVLREGDASGATKIRTLVAFAAGAGSPGQGRGWLRAPGGGNPQALALATMADKSQVVYTASADALVELARTGADFASLGLPAVNDDGHSAFLATSPIGGPVTKANARAIFADLTGGGSYQPLVRVGDAAVQGAKFSLLKDPVLAADDAIAFPATLKGGTVKGPAMQTLWWQPVGGTLTLLAQGGARPGADLPADAQWKSFPSLAIAANRGPVFTATLVPGKGGVTAKNATGLWACDFSGAPRLLFRTGDVIDGRTLKSFAVLKATVGNRGVTRSLNDNAQVVWLATFTDLTQAIITTEVP